MTMETAEFESLKAELRQRAKELITLADPRSVKAGSEQADAEMAKAMQNLITIDNLIIHSGLEMAKIEQEYNLAYIVKAQYWTDEHLDAAAETRSGKHSLIKRELHEEARRLTEIKEINRFFVNQRDTMRETLHFYKKIHGAAA